MHTHHPPAKKIGIIAGSGPEAGIDLWSKVLQANRDLHGSFFRGDLDAPSVTVVSEPILGLSMELDTHHDQVWECLKSCAETIARRADYYAIACNTLDYFYPQLDALRLPGRYVSFVKVAQEFLEHNRITRVALLGARPVTDFGPWSPYRRLAEHVEVELPSSTQAELLQRMIYDVKTFGSDSREIRARFRAILNTLQSDTVLLACAELPLINLDPAGRQLLDVTRLVAERLARLANPQLGLAALSSSPPERIMKKHIGLIYAGGTVGMRKTGQGYAPMPEFGRVLAELLDTESDAIPRYTLHEYATPIDSTNATPADWQRIGRDIAGRYRDYDGFVILHGTDTMAYTAAALSFMLQGLRKPVILTGSQIPLSEARSDAPLNIVTSLQLAASGEVKEVALHFNQRLLRGNRSTKISAQRFQAFDSPNYPWLAEAGIGIRVNHAALLPAARRENFELPDYASGRILSFRAMPGMPLQAVRMLLDLQPQALILECYGAGNLPDNDPTLLDLLAHANHAGTVLLARSQALHGAVTLDAYATGSGLARAGVVGCGDMTFEAIYTKLHHLFALGLTPAEVKLAMRRGLAGEISEFT